MALRSTIPFLPVFFGASFLDTALEHLLHRCEQFAALGAIGVVIFIGIYVASSLCCMPCIPFTLMSGALFGVAGGTAVTMCGIIGGATANFLIARHVFRRALAAKLLARPRLALVDRAVARDGWRIVALLRLCPIPFGLSNYAYGLTAIEFWHYIFATIPSMIPGTLLFVYFGSAGMRSLQSATEGHARNPAEWGLLVLAAVAGVAALAIIGRIVKRAVEHRVD